MPSELTRVLHHVLTFSSANGRLAVRMPALANTTSATRPKASLTDAKRWSVSASFVTSVTTASVRVAPVLSSSRAAIVSSSFSLRRPEMTTPSAPARTQIRAMAFGQMSALRVLGFQTRDGKRTAPIPLPPPVTTTILPFAALRFSSFSGCSSSGTLR